ncbi:M14 family zinc carboxypeptidase [Flavobacterium sp.]|uniref:M14 family zinc carboxypeptidase n=1 Tax=Flavobacterium sp. TaxID=239 RepID=UPI00260EF957|nr:M14 family zinc carboxypeptidase [Flavobacterium sp.]MDD2986118.1 M14 family zinc carboxypeptidase [Flavobacterium sp.]
MKRIYFLFLFLSVLTTTAQPKSPFEFLPNYGKNVTYYHQVENYFQHLVASSDWMQHQKYGETSQERNLNAYFISSPENLKNLEEIRKNHLNSIGLFPTKNQAVKDKTIVWLSFNVHGNEFGALESALSVAYELVNPKNLETKKWLQDIIVILDPCLNPDGFSRYANWLRDISGTKTHPGHSDREHMEPWPGGRQNHYVFDLNRDWAWQTQLETQLRMNLYHEWMPMVHADVHEMGYNEPYFFPPAAEPYHEQIAPFQREFHQKIGELTSTKFDKEGWMYYSGERFDLFYPSYGDTYPCYNGAVGMTYEQGGIGAGRAIVMRNGEILSIKDRINHHTKALLAVVELSFLQQQNLTTKFRDYFKENRSKPKGEFQTYIVKDHPRNLELLTLLNRNRIEASFANESKKLKGYHYQTNKEKTFEIEPNDLIISVDQPKAVLTQVLFEPHQKLTDSLSYDITAWSLPFAYGVESYALKGKLALQTKSQRTITVPQKTVTVYAYYVPWNDRNSAKVLSLLHQQNFQVRSASKEVAFNNIKIEKGGLLITKGDNLKIKNFEETIQKILVHKAECVPITTGFAANGADLGGEFYPLLKAPKVLLLSGNGVSNIDFGQVWYYMDQVIEFPLSIIELDYFKKVNLTNYTTLILADGYYNFSESEQKNIDEFVSNGGKVIAMGGGMTMFEDREGYHLTKFATEEEKTNATQKEEEEELYNRFLDYEGSERRSISAYVPGAIIENTIDITHPLTFGLGANYFSLKTTPAVYKLLKGAENVIYVPKKFQSFGFVGSKLKGQLAETVSFAVDAVGKGKVIYMIDNPLFRGFWENGNLLFSNALFLVD